MARRSDPMSDEHKAALAQGRTQGRAVRRYLEALDAHQPRRGRKRTADSIRARLERIETDMADAEVLKRLHLIQERIDLTVELEEMEAETEIADLEQEFVAAAKPYGERKGISYVAWRELGVSPGVLKKAGIGRAD